MLFFHHKKTYKDNEIKIVLHRLYKAEKAFNIDKTYVYDIYLIDTNQLIGQCDLRVGTGWYLYYLGHIGYTIYKPYRGHHYAGKACRLLLRQAKEEKMDKLIITCNPDNIASYKTIQYFGAKYLETVNVPINHDLYLRGETIKCIFEIYL